MLCLQSGHRVVNLSIWGGRGFSIRMTARGTRLRISPTAPEEKLTVLDLAYRLDYYCFVLFDYFSLLLHFLTLLIKLILD